ncbi:MAG: hypothetical protein JW837_00800 [Sedimentisphaerales bacterium]|nr:hypothetical protein [Sedimentisphaerales bacterium]
MVTFKYITHVILFAIVVTVLAGCDEPFIIPEHDNTPPTVGCSIFLHGEEIVLTPGGTDIVRELNPNVEHEISIAAIGKDTNGGVKSVCIHRESEWSCTDGQYGQLYQPNIPSQCSSDNKRPGDKGKQRRYAGDSFIVPMGDEICGQEGYKWTVTTGSISATAENYHDGIAQTVKFKYEVRAR